jgi:hypothetical protein
MGDYPNQTDAKAYTGPYSSGNELGFTGWVAMAATAAARRIALVVDLSHLPAGAAVSMIRYGHGAGGFEQAEPESFNSNTRFCCWPTVDVRYQPCPPASCPIKSTALAIDRDQNFDRKQPEEQLPASPFVALVVKGKCRCLKPQVCDSN